MWACNGSSKKKNSSRNKNNLWGYKRNSWCLSLREKCPNTKFFLARIFSHSDWIRRDTEYLSVFSQNVGQYGPEKSLYLNTFYAVYDFALMLYKKITLQNAPAARTSKHWLTLMRKINNLTNESKNKSSDVIKNI